MATKMKFNRVTEGAHEMDIEKSLMDNATGIDTNDRNARSNTATRIVATV